MKTINHHAALAATLAWITYASGLLHAHAQTTTNGGVVFPQGLRSFADAVVDYRVGSPAPTAPHQNPANALGAPNYAGVNSCSSSVNCSFVSLGVGGQVTLQFIDNVLTGSDSDDYDLWIFEVGPDVEDTFVEISRDGQTWYSVGKVAGNTRGVDLDAYGFGSTDRFSFVRLTDDPDEGGQSGATVGADIDAIGAISSGYPPPSLTIAHRPNSQVEVSWKSESNVVYQVRSTSDLLAQPWLSIGAPIAGSGTTNSLVDTVLGQTNRFYQVYMYPAP